MELQDVYQDNHKADSGKIVFCDSPKIIILEDDRALSTSLKVFLQKSLNAEVVVFHSGKDFIENFINMCSIDESFCLLTDISLGEGHDGLYLLDLLKDRDLNFFSIVMTGFASIETAITATKKGVYHYLTKPFELEDLNKLIIDGFAQKLRTIIHNVNVIKYGSSQEVKEKKSLEVFSVDDDVQELPEVTEENIFSNLVSRNEKMKQVFERVQKIARTGSAVLISGESGTGRELLAEAIHEYSCRSTYNFNSINCGAIPPELLESELFGHVQGAFNGAISNRVGKFKTSDESTLFLDEISRISLELQEKILKALQSKTFLPLGATESLSANTRVIAATSESLEEEVELGNFREDLFYRLNVIPIHIPALRERKDDIPLLISFFLSKYVSADKSNMIKFKKSAFNYLVSYSWPGNVRELEEVIERLVVLKGGSVIQLDDLPSKIYQGNPLTNRSYKTLFELPEEGVKLKKILSDIEDSLILQALERTKGNKNRASQLLDLNRTTLIEKIKKKKLLG